MQMSSILAAQFAEKLLSKRAITTLPIDPLALAEAEAISVQAKPESVAGVSGLLMRVGSNFGIMYATHIPNEGYQRFSVAHELGHYFLPGHIDAIFSDDSKIHASHAGFVSDDRYEIEADHFAAGLLMPDPMFRNALLRADDGLAGIEYLASLCRTSLNATAIRYIDKATIPAAVIVSKGTQIEYCLMSAALKEFPDLRWLKKGFNLPKCSLTQKFNDTADNVRNAARDENSADLQDWFGGKRSLEVLEQVIGLGSYEKTLTVITCDTFADEEDEDEHLRDSWSPHF